MRTSIRLSTNKNTTWLSRCQPTLHRLNIGAAYLCFSLLVLTICGSAAISLVLWIFSQRLPDPNTLTQRAIPQSTVILDRNGQPLYQVYKDQNRTLVSLDQIPPSVIQATLAAEDASFYRHGGIDLHGFAYAAYQTFVTGHTQGGSTITQQLVKNTLLNNQQTFGRKIREFILSMRLEQRYTKDEILQMYLNEIPYGGEVYGIQAASKTFFNKDVQQLTTAEAALLAGLPQSPSRYSPFHHPQAALSRQKYVLHLMEKARYLTSKDRDKLAQQEITFASPKVTIDAPWFTLWVKAQLEQQYGKKMIEEGGLRITTTLDLQKQKVAEEEIHYQLDRLANAGANAHQAALLSLDPKTGQILAMVGSEDYFDSSSDGQVNGTMAMRQPGSAIKPFVYYTGLASRQFTTASMLKDDPTSFYVGPNQPPYQPAESDGRFWGPMLLRDALANSRNIPTVKVMNRIGLNSMINTTVKAGIPTYQKNPGRYGLSLSLGGGETRMIDLATGYMTLANNGQYRPVVSVLKIETAQGKLIYQAPPVQPEQHLDPRYSYLITNILSDNKARQKLFGPNNQLQLDRPAAVKTGTTDNNKDAWTVGYTPNLLTAVWVGNFDGQAMNGIMGSTGATPIWHHFMQRNLNTMPVEQFTRPAGLVERPITTSGQLSCSSRTTYRVELFVKGTEPKNCHGLIQPPNTPTPPTRVAGEQIWRFTLDPRNNNSHRRHN